MQAETLVDGLDHPEGVAYDPATGAVYAGGELGQLYRVDLERRAWEQVATAPGFVLGVAVDGRGRVALCVSDGTPSVCVWDGERVRVVSDGFTFPNYGAFAPDGTFFFSDSGRWACGDGRVFRLASDGSLDELHGLRDFPNGCAVSPDGRWLWVAQSYDPTVSRFDLATGEVEHVIRIDRTVPDGLAFTADGGLLVSCYRPDRIYHLAADGSLEIVADDHQGTTLGAPTNVCFVGPDLDRVVSANLGRWHLTLLDLGLRGVAPHRPERWAADS
jgi:sugar lactone lactonase YvrE